MDFFTQLFTELNNYDSYSILLFLFISFILGWLFGFIMRGGKVSRLKKELKAKDTEYKKVVAEHDALKLQYDEQATNFKNLGFELEEYKKSVAALEDERTKIKGDFYAANDQLKKLEASNEEYTSQINDLNTQIVSLKSKNVQLNDEVERDADTLNEFAQMQSSYQATTSRLEAVEAKLDQLAQENSALRSTLDNLKEHDSAKVTTSSGSSNVTSSGSSYVPTPVMDIPDENTTTSTSTETDDTVETTIDENYNDSTIVSNGNVEDNDEDINNENRSTRARVALGNMMGTRIRRATPEEKDDLKLINGIGPFIEDKLNDIGIYTFDQISEFDPIIIELVTDAIQFFPGRIDRDDWVGQSSSLLTK